MTFNPKFRLHWTSLLSAVIVSQWLSSGAGAQSQPNTPTGSHMPVKPEPQSLPKGPSLSDQQTRQVIAKFAKCVISKHRNAAARYLQGQAIKVEIASLADSECIPSDSYDNLRNFSMALPPNVFRYALADALVNDEFPTFGPSQITNAAPFAPAMPDLAQFTPKPGKTYQPEDLKKLEQQKAAALAYVAFEEFGDCVVRGNAPAAHALIRTSPTSPEETAAIQALIPGLSQCLGVGEQFKANETSLRGIVALSYYRIAHAPRLPQNSQVAK